MKRWNTLLAACGLGLALALPAAAQPGGACREDVARLCADAAGGPRGVAVCLKQHHDALSPACRAQVESRAGERRRMQRLGEACLEDVARFCDEIDSARDRVVCLRSHGAELSPECREALPPGR